MKNARPENNLPPAVHLFEIAAGFMKSQALYAAASLGIADYLKEGSKSITDLARITNADRDSLLRLLRALASIEIFAGRSDGIFENTELSNAMLSDSPISLHPYILLLGDISWWNSWGNLFSSVKTGQSAFDSLFGIDYSEYLNQNRELAKIFNDCMTSVSRVNNPAILNSYDFSAFGTIVDVGGGHGSLLTTILDAYPRSKGILFDQPAVVASIEGLEKEI